MDSSIARQIDVSRRLIDAAYGRGDLGLAKFTLGLAAGAVIAAAPEDEQAHFNEISSLEAEATELDHVANSVLWFIDRASQLAPSEGNPPAYRFTVAETEGSKRAYSYSVGYELPLGEFSGDDLPAEIEAELESLGQSDSAPSFLWAPSGQLIYSVTDGEHHAH